MSTVLQFVCERFLKSWRRTIYTLHPHKRSSSGLVSSLKSHRNIFSRLFVASQFRDGNFNDYFSHKNQPCPPSLSARGKLKLGTKSDIVRCLEDAPEK